MTAIAIPTTADPYTSQTTGLDGVPYVLTFAYGQRSDTWTLSIAMVDGTPIASGLKLVCLWDLLAQTVDPNRPPGMLFVLSSTTDLSPPGLEDLAPGGRCTLIYTPAADVAALTGAA